MAEPLADEDADHSVDGVKEPDQQGAHLHLFGQKQAQGRYLERYCNSGHKGHGQKREGDGITPLQGCGQQAHRITTGLGDKNWPKFGKCMKWRRLFYVIIKSYLKACDPAPDPVH
ncbi:hypothetical protein GCM10009412_02340 [Aeromonas salmonicida subsp. achromogenes]